MNSRPDDDITLHVDLSTAAKGADEALRKVSELEAAAKRLQATLKQVEQQAVSTFNAALASGPPKTGSAAMFGSSQFGGGAVSGYGELRDILNQGGRPAIEAAAPDIKPQLDAILKLRQQINATVNAAATAQNDAAQKGVPVAAQHGAIASLTQADKHADRDEKTYRAAEEKARKSDLADERRAAKDQAAAEKVAQREEQRYRQAEAAARKSDLADEERDKKRISAIEERTAKAREREAARYVPFSQRLAGSVFSARTLAGVGALSTGDSGPLGRTLAYSFVTALAHTPLNMLKPAAGAVAGELSAGGADGAAVAGATGAEGAAAGAAAPSLASMIGGLLTGPIGLVIAAAATAALGGVVIQSMRASARAQQVTMLGDVAGVPLNAPSVEESHLLSQGERYLYSPDEARSSANQLGYAGVQGNDLPKVLADVMTFARRTGIDLPSATELGGLVATRNDVNGHGNGTDDQVSAVFQTIEDAARQAGIPVKRLADAVKTLATATGGAGLTVGAVNGLATIQSMIGPTGNAGQLMAPSLGATGGQALQMAGVLGLSADQLYAMQQNDPAALMDRIAGFAKRATGGRKGMAGVDIAESVLSGTGMLNFAGIDPKHQAAFVRDLLTQGPHAAEQREQARIKQQASITSSAAARDSGADVARQTISVVQQMATHIKYAGDQAANAGNDVKLFGNTAHDMATLMLQGASNTPGKALGADLGLDPSKKGQPGPNGERGGSWHLVAGAPDDAGPRSAYFQPAKPYSFQDDPAYDWHQGRAAMDSLRDAQGNPISVAVPNTRGQTDQAGGRVLKDYVYASQKYKIPLSVLLAVGAKESDFHGDAVSPDGGLGMAQLTPGTGIMDTLTKTKGSPFYGAKFDPHGGGKAGTIDPFNVEQSTEAQAWYLAHLQQQYGSLPLAVQHYNGSGAAAQAYSAAVLQAAQQVDMNLKIQLTDGAGRPVGQANARTRVDLGRKPVGHKTHGPPAHHLKAHAKPQNG